MLNTAITYAMINILHLIILLYFASKKYPFTNKDRKNYLWASIINIPFVLHATLSSILLYHIYLNEVYFGSVILDTLYNIGGVVLMFITRIYIIYHFTTATKKQAFIYYLLNYFITTLRYEIEDIFLFIIQHSLFLTQYQLFLQFIFKIISFTICCYLTNLLFYRMDVDKIKKHEIALILIIFSVGIVYDDNILYYAIYATVCMLLYYFVFYKLSKRLEILNRQEYEKAQFDQINEEYKRHQTQLELLSKVRHDQKNHMLTFYQLYQKDKQQALDYFYSWHQDVSKKLEDIS